MSAHDNEARIASDAILSKWRSGDPEWMNPFVDRDIAYTGSSQVFPSPDQSFFSLSRNSVFEFLSLVFLASGIMSVANRHLKPAFSRPILKPPAPENREIKVGFLFDITFLKLKLRYFIISSLSKWFK